MPAPVIEWVRPGVGFTPEAAASFRRAEAAWGRLIDVNSSYRSWSTQLSMWVAWQAWVAGVGPHPGHSRALHPDSSKHCQGLALDSDDWTVTGFIVHMLTHGWVRTAAWDPTERHHFEYQADRDQFRNAPAVDAATPFPVPTPTIPQEAINMADRFIYENKRAGNKSIPDNERRGAFTNSDSGFCVTISWFTEADAAAFAKQLDKDGVPLPLSADGFDKYVAGLAAVRNS